MSFIVLEVWLSGDGKVSEMFLKQFVRTLLASCFGCKDYLIRIHYHHCKAIVQCVASRDPCTRKWQGARFLKRAPEIRFDVIPMDGFKRRSLGVYICNFGVQQRYEQWQIDNFRQGWPRAYHATIQKNGIISVFG